MVRYCLCRLWLLRFLGSEVFCGSAGRVTDLVLWIIGERGNDSLALLASGADGAKLMPRIMVRL
jgi:hypothetical protein